MGIVYRAFDRVGQHPVALKVLRKTEPSAVRRFATEVEALGKLDHADIVRYLAHGIADNGSPYLAIEWIEGEDLRTRLARASEAGESIAMDDIVELGQRLAGALAAAHALGIVHRDVKPSNILLVHGNLRRPKLVDFGIVRSAAAAAAAEHVTTSGTVLGTVGYMAPEQARGAEQLDGRADLFSLGCVLFRCVAGRDVFDGPDPVTVLSMLLTHQPPKLADFRADVPPELDALVAQLLVKDPEKRPASAASVEQTLLRIGKGLLGETLTLHGLIEPPPKTTGGAKAADPTPPPTRARRPRWIGAAIPLTVVLLALAIAIHPWRRANDSPIASATVAPPAPTILTALPISPSCDPRAVALYHQGMQTLREGRWDRAYRVFELATQADATCPEARLRHFLLSREQITPISIRREHLREVMRLRDALSARDRLVLEAFSMVVTEDVPRREEAVRILDEGVRRFPMDAEMLFRAVGERMNVARSREDFEAALELAGRAAAIDPSYSDVWQAKARLLEHLGREDEVRAALDQCLAMSPGSVDCMADRVFALSRAGQCREAAAEARRRSSWDPEEAIVYRSLAETLAASGAPKEAIEEVLVQRHGRLPAETRESERLLDRAQLEAWTGQFDAALGTAERLQQHLANSASRESHWAASMVSGESFFELGDTAGGSRVAELALLRKEAWTPDKTVAVSVAATEAWLLAAASRGGRQKLPEWRKATRAWELANEDSLNAYERWALTWGTKVESKADALQALADAPPAEPREASRHFHVAWHIGVLDAYAGRIFLQADEPARAAPLLERAVQACQSIYYPFLNVRAHLWLGMAKEKLRDTAAACSAYRFVVDRWGHAVPRSVTASEAKRHLRTLACEH